MKTPRFTHPKRQGEWAELAFMTRAAGLGFNVLRPHGDSMPFDVVLEHGGRFIRVQVKSTRSRQGTNYYAGCGHSNSKRLAYSRRDVDFIAVLVVPKDVWYILPIEAIRGRKAIRLCPTNARQSHEFERYREAWHLIGRPRSKRTKWGRVRS